MRPTRGQLPGTLLIVARIRRDAGMDNRAFYGSLRLWAARVLRRRCDALSWSADQSCFLVMGGRKEGLGNPALKCQHIRCPVIQIRPNCGPLQDECLVNQNKNNRGLHTQVGSRTKPSGACPRQLAKNYGPNQDTRTDRIVHRGQELLEPACSSPRRDGVYPASVRDDNDEVSQIVRSAIALFANIRAEESADSGADSVLPIRCGINVSIW